VSGRRWGRIFTANDETDGSPKTAILTWGYWQEHFGGANSAVGRHMTIDGEDYEVIGVLARSFRFMDPQPRLIVPLQFNRAKAVLGNFSYQGIARLKPGATFEQASADVARMIPIWLRSFPAPTGFTPKIFEDAKLTPRVRPFLRDVVGDIGIGLPRLGEIGIDPAALLFTIGISLPAGLLFGILPVVKYAGARAGSGLRDSNRSVSAGRERHRARNLLVVAQVELALLLLIASGLMIRTFVALRSVDPGFT
jgi:hypothetical protein